MGIVLAMPRLASAAVTETDFFDELPVVLSVSRLSQPVSEAPAAVTVIDRSMIRASGFRDIPDLLRLVPGFSVAYTRDNTWAAGYHGLGDAYSRRFQVLVDGRSIYSPHYGAVNWASLPLAIDDIERIEVVRGPNASTYGANAFAAVVNIITKTAAQVAGGLVSVQVGEQDMRGVTLRRGGGSGEVGYRLTASAQQRDRFERDVTHKPADSNANGQYFEASQSVSVNGRMDWQLAPDTDVMAQFGLFQGNWDAGARTADTRSILEPTRQDTRGYYVQLAYHKVESAQRDWRVQFTHTQNDFDADQTARLTLTSPAFDDILNVDQRLSQARTTLDLQVNEQWLPDLRAVWGGEVWRESVDSPQNYAAGARQQGDIARVYGNLEWRPHERLLLQGGAMLERHYFTGVDLSPRVAANFALVRDHVLRLGVSRAYRSPTFFEENGNQVLRNAAGAVVDVVTVPSGGLAPERILSREIGYVGKWRAARLELDMRLYRDHIDNFIGQIRSSAADVAGSFQPKVFTADNLGSVDAQGGEVQLRWRPTTDLDLSARYARVFLTSNATDKALKRDIPLSAPRDNWGVLASYQFGHGWETSVFVQRSDAQKWLTEGDITKAFTRVDVRLARRWRWQGTEVEAAVVGQNLGRDYHEFRDTNVFSRRVYGSLSLGW
ncbi:MAG: TonB-dependent receptor [Thiobacillus sp.]|nr:TonB-dependent receptor [Thiobacillus sp.]